MMKETFQRTAIDMTKCNAYHPKSQLDLVPHPVKSEDWALWPNMTPSWPFTFLRAKEGAWEGKLVCHLEFS